MNNGKSTHKIYFVDYTYPKRAKSSDEALLRKNNKKYNTIYRKRTHSNDSIKNNIKWVGKPFLVNYLGLIEYLPKNNENINKSANIICNIYHKKYIFKRYYDVAIRYITEFINNNNITSIEVSSEDVDRLKLNNIDLINDITDKLNHKCNINISKGTYSINDYIVV